jgi:Uma2 family endonuclease
MKALLDLPSVRERLHRMTVDDYHRAGKTGVLSDDVELLRGIVVTKMPKSPEHELVANKTGEILSKMVPEEFKIRREGPLTLRDSEPEPDISVVRGGWEDWADAHPSTAMLVIEVAVTSEEMDENKADIYAEASVAEYWLIRVHSRVVEVFTKPTREGYLSQRTVRENEVLLSIALPSVSIRVQDILPAR